jgi:hypothetical protein
LYQKQTLKHLEIMTKINALRKLENSGYKVTTVMSNNIMIASKGFQSYKAKSLNGLIKQIF